jgi:hypothetical protein
MHAALQACLQAENADRKTFTFLADVEASGKLSKVDVYPETSTAMCFSARASKWVYAKSIFLALSDAESSGRTGD